MSQTAQRKIHRKMFRGKKPRRVQAGRRPVSATLPPLEEQILSILRSAPAEGLSLLELVQKLKQMGETSAETHVVRDAVWQLIHKRQADFTPRRLVALVSG